MMNFYLADACTPDFLPSLYKGLYDASCNVHIEKITDIAIILANVIQFLIALAGALAVIFVIWGAINYIISEGDSSRTKDAKSTITNAIVGLILASGAYILVDFFARQFS